MRFLRGLRAVALVLFACAGVWACGGEHPASSIDPATDYGETIQSLYAMVFWITLVILVIVWGAMAYVFVKFRERPNTPHPRQIHGHLGVEILWTILPAVIVVVIAIPTVQTVFRTQRAPAEGGLTIDVIGHQFWWEFRYPDGVVTANEVHVPVGPPITLRLHSVDVIHSFWIPRIGGKRDVNPLVTKPAGDTIVHENFLHFTVREPGVYRGQCAEFCGTAHSIMGVRLVAESPADFDAWETAWKAPPPDSAAIAQATDSLVELGRKTFHSATCIACHSIQDTNAGGQIGPNLTLLGRRTTIVGWLDNTPENLSRWITSPTSVKPGARMPGIAEMGGNFPPTNLTADQVRAVAAYLWSLGRLPARAAAQ